MAVSWNLQYKHMIYTWMYEMTKIPLSSSSSATKTTNPSLIGYTNEGYKSDPHKTRSQTDYLFCYNNTIIFWRFTK